MYASLKTFNRSERGNIAMLFALTLIPLLIFAGVSVDFLNNQRAQSSVSQGVDAALLAAARARASDRSLSDAKIREIAWRVFRSNVPEASSFGIDEEDFNLSIPRAGSDDAFALSVTGALNTAILAIIGRDSLPIAVSAEARIGQPRTLEVALVLDNTFSMAGSRIAALKSAASGLAETIMEDDANGAMIALVPFSQYVNVGLQNRDAPWLDVARDRTSRVTENVCRRNNPNLRRRDCTPVTRTCTRLRDGVEESYECEELVCPNSEGEAVETCADETREVQVVWNGCVGSRNYPFNVQDRQYDARRVPGLLEIECTQPITPLTDNRAAVLAAIQGMTIQGDDTYIPTGFVWGYRALSPIAPFDEGVTYEQIEQDGGQKVLIVMSDGANTVSASFPEHNERDRGLSADRIFIETCDAAKADGIEVYSIAFEVDNSAISELLERCASSSDQFFDAEDADALEDTFQRIASSLVELALTR